MFPELEVFLGQWNSYIEHFPLAILCSSWGSKMCRNVFSYSYFFFFFFCLRQSCHTAQASLSLCPRLPPKCRGLQVCYSLQMQPPLWSHPQWERSHSIQGRTWSPWGTMGSIIQKTLQGQFFYSLPSNGRLRSVLPQTEVKGYILGCRWFKVKNRDWEQTTGSWVAPPSLDENSLPSSKIKDHVFALLHLNTPCSQSHHTLDPRVN